MSEISVKSPWEALTPEEKLEAREAVWTSKNLPGNIVAEITGELAKLMRFRPTPPAPPLFHWCLRVLFLNPRPP